MTSSVGSFVEIDFADPQSPLSKLDFDFASCGYALCIVDTGGSHSDLTDEYAAVPQRDGSVAEYLGKERPCARSGEDEFMKNASRYPLLLRRQSCASRHCVSMATTRASRSRQPHSRRATSRPLRNIYIERTLFLYVQPRVSIPCKKASERPVSLALSLSQKLLDGCGMASPRRRLRRNNSGLCTAQ